MGSGISLSREHIVQIIKRDLLQVHYHNQKVIGKNTEITAQEIYYNCLANAQLNIINKNFNKSLK